MGFPVDIHRVHEGYSRPLSSDEFTKLIETVLTADWPVIVDTGAVVFFPLLELFSAPETSEKLRRAGKQLLVHQVLAGQPDYQEQTVRGAELVLDSMPHDRFIVWFNEYFFPVFRSQQRWEATALHQKYGHQLAGLVRFPFDCAGHHRAIVSRRLELAICIEEALHSSEFSPQQQSLMAAAQQCLHAQLDSVLAPQRLDGVRAAFPLLAGLDGDETPIETTVSKMCRLGVTFKEALHCPEFSHEERTRAGAMMFSIYGQLGLFLEPGRMS
jgi:hypothetical protein